MQHDQPDPNICPTCERSGALRELAKRYTWQPVTLGYVATGSDETPTLDGIEYDSFDWGDDVEVTGYDCAECGAEWPDVYALAHAQRLHKALADHRDHWESRAERLKDLANADRLDTVNGAEKIADADARAEAFALSLAILAGNGEA